MNAAMFWVDTAPVKSFSQRKVMFAMVFSIVAIFMFGVAFADEPPKAMDTGKVQVQLNPPVVKQGNQCATVSGDCICIDGKCYCVGPNQCLQPMQYNSGCYNAPYGFYQHQAYSAGCYGSGGNGCNGSYGEGGCYGNGNGRQKRLFGGGGCGILGKRGGKLSGGGCCN